MDDFVRNHANAIIAADFFVVVTATFQVMYVLLIMEIGTRRILHLNVTPHPTAAWTLQQFRECVAGDEGYRFIIHDRDSIYSLELGGPLLNAAKTSATCAWCAEAVLLTTVLNAAVNSRKRGSSKKETL